jgi:hypothetical protein
MFVLKMYVQIMSLSVLLCNVCVYYVYILKMSKKIKVKKKKNNNNKYLVYTGFSFIQSWVKTGFTVVAYKTF